MANPPLIPTKPQSTEKKNYVVISALGAERDSSILGFPSSTVEMLYAVPEVQDRIAVLDRLIFVEAWGHLQPVLRKDPALDKEVREILTMGGYAGQGTPDKRTRSTYLETGEAPRNKEEALKKLDTLITRVKQLIAEADTLNGPAGIRSLALKTRYQEELQPKRIAANDRPIVTKIAVSPARMPLPIDCPLNNEIPETNVSEYINSVNTWIIGNSDILNFIRKQDVPNRTILAGLEQANGGRIPKEKFPEVYAMLNAWRDGMRDVIEVGLGGEVVGPNRSANFLSEPYLKRGTELRKNASALNEVLNNQIAEIGKKYNLTLATRSESASSTDLNADTEEAKLFKELEEIKKKLAELKEMRATPVKNSIDALVLPYLNTSTTDQKTLNLMTQLKIKLASIDALRPELERIMGILYNGDPTSADYAQVVAINARYLNDATKNFISKDYFDNFYDKFKKLDDLRKKGKITEQKWAEEALKIATRFEQALVKFNDPKWGQGRRGVSVRSVVGDLLRVKAIIDIFRR